MNMTKEGISHRNIVLHLSLSSSFYKRLWQISYVLIEISMIVMPSVQISAVHGEGQMLGKLRWRESKREQERGRESERAWKEKARWSDSIWTKSLFPKHIPLSPIVFHWACAGWDPAATTLLSLPFSSNSGVHVLSAHAQRRGNVPWFNLASLIRSTLCSWPEVAGTGQQSLSRCLGWLSNWWCARDWGCMQNQLPAAGCCRLYF